MKQAEKDQLKALVAQLNTADDMISAANDAIQSSTKSLESASAALLMSYLALNRFVVEATVDAPPVVVPPPPPPPTPTPTGVMHAVGRDVFSANGKKFVARGLEQMIFSFDAAAARTIGEMGKTGANACRPNKFSGMTDSQIFTMFDDVRSCGMTPYVVFPQRAGLAWFGQANVKSYFQAPGYDCVLDILLEPEGDATAVNIAAWLSNAKAAITQVRGYGYRGPLSIHAMTQGRDLRQILLHGAELVTFDPLHNLLLGVQLYWPIRAGGFEWQADQGFGSGAAGIAEALRQISVAPFPVQIGIALGDENRHPLQLGPSGTFPGILALCQQYSIGYLHWDWYEDNNQDTLSTDGTFANLTAGGKIVVPHIQTTSVRI